MYDYDDDPMRPIYDAYYENDTSTLVDLVVMMIENSKLNITSAQARQELQKYVDTNNLNAIVAIATKVNKPRTPQPQHDEWV